MKSVDLGPTATEGWAIAVKALPDGRFEASCRNDSAPKIPPTTASAASLAVAQHGDRLRAEALRRRGGR